MKNINISLDGPEEEKWNFPPIPGLLRSCKMGGISKTSPKKPKKQGVVFPSLKETGWFLKAVLR